MKLDEKRLQQLALTYPVDATTLEAAQIARELLAARAVVEAARLHRRDEEPSTAVGLDDALVAYDETVR